MCALLLAGHMHHQWTSWLVLPGAADRPFCFPHQNGARGDTRSDLPPSSGRDAEPCPGGKRGCEIQSSGGKERPERVCASSELALAAW